MKRHQIKKVNQQNPSNHQDTRQSILLQRVFQGTGAPGNSSTSVPCGSCLVNYRTHWKTEIHTQMILLLENVFKLQSAYKHFASFS